MPSPKSNKAFTLIELLMVIAIIGLLSSVIFVALSSARAKARNAVRLSNIKNYVTVFEIVYDSHGEFPDPGDSFWYCLGDYENDECWLFAEFAPGRRIYESPLLNDILDDWIALPADKTLVCYQTRPDICYGGAIYHCADRTDGICNSIEARWFMEGTGQSCGIGSAVMDIGDATLCHYEAHF